MGVIVARPVLPVAGAAQWHPCLPSKPRSPSFGVSASWPSPRAGQHLRVLQSAQRGWRAGMCGVGLCHSGGAHSAAVAPGAGGGVCSPAMAFTVLIPGRGLPPAWLACAAGRSSVHEAPPGELGGGRQRRRPAHGGARRGDEPDELVFFLVFLPQFAGPGAGGMARQIMPWAWCSCAGDAVGAWRHCLLLGGVWRCCSVGKGATALTVWAGLAFLGLRLRLATAQR